MVEHCKAKSTGGFYRLDVSRCSQVRSYVETHSDGPLRFIGGERARPHPVQAVDFTHQMTLRIVVMVVVIAAALQRQSPVLLELELADHLLERLQAGT